MDNELFKKHIDRLQGYIKTNGMNISTLVQEIENNTDDFDQKLAELRQLYELLPKEPVVERLIQTGRGNPNAVVTPVVFDEDNERLIITDASGNETFVDLSYFDDNCFDTNETTLTALQPAYIDNTGAWLPAQGTPDLSANALVVAEGRAIEKGVYELPAHGLIVGMEYVTDPNNLGQAIPRTQLATGEPYQKLFTVVNADEISVDVEPLIEFTAQEFLCREDFLGFAGGETSITVIQPLPVNSSIEVYRSNVLAIEGITNDYTQSSQTFNFTPALTPGETVSVVWVKNVAGVFRQDFTGLTAGDTVVDVTDFNLNPSNVNVLVYRQNVLLIEGSTNDYTITGNSITLNSPIVAGETYSVINYN